MIVSWTAGETEQGMPDDMLVDLCQLVSEHPWWEARAALLITLLKRIGVSQNSRVLDAGCGWGVNLEALERSGYEAVGLDGSRVVLEALNRPGRLLIHADLAKPAPQDAGEFDAVIALDVIEHLDDDRAAIANLAKLTRPGGSVVVSVPALPALYSDFDKVQGHLPVMLRAAFADSDLRIDRILWWGWWLVPLFFLRRIGRQRAHGDLPAAVYRRQLALPRWPMSALFRVAFRVDNALTAAGWSPIGTSLFAIAHRPDPSPKS